VFSPYRGEDNLIDGVVASTRDISENKQAEEVLQQYKHIVDTNADMMALIDSNYIYKAVNKKYPDAFEKPLEQAVGCHVKDVMGEKMFLESAKENLDKALSGETVNFQI